MQALQTRSSNHCAFPEQRGTKIEMPQEVFPERFHAKVIKLTTEGQVSSNYKTCHYERRQQPPDNEI